MMLTGVAASKGQAQGPARITTGDARDVQKGEILVTRMTTPNMVPAMRRATGIVTEIGGRTCHAAIVARELRIPCVVAVAGALGIPSGAMVAIDGLAATVKVS